MAETKTTPQKETKPKADKPKETKKEPKKAAIKPISGVISATGTEWDTIKFPHLSEKSIANIETQNKIIFVVKRTASRAQVKKTVESMFGVKVEKVNLMTTAKGDKKAYVRLKPEYSALDIATRLGMM